MPVGGTNVTIEAIDEWGNKSIKVFNLYFYSLYSARSSDCTEDSMMSIKEFENVLICSTENWLVDGDGDDEGEGVLRRRTSLSNDRKRGNRGVNSSSADVLSSNE